MLQGKPRLVVVGIYLMRHLQDIILIHPTRFCFRCSFLTPNKLAYTLVDLPPSLFAMTCLPFLQSRKLWTGCNIGCNPFPKSYRLLLIPHHWILGGIQPTTYENKIFSQWPLPSFFFVIDDVFFIFIFCSLCTEHRGIRWWNTRSDKTEGGVWLLTE